MKDPTFKFGDKVISVINPDYIGQVTAIIYQQDQILYAISTFDEDGKSMVTNMFDVEITLAPADGSMGFSKKR